MDANPVLTAADALERGELVRLMADVDAGRLSAADFRAAMRLHRRRHWLAVLLCSLLRLHW